MLTQEPPGDVETKEVVVSSSKTCLQQGPEEQLEDVGSCEAASGPPLGHHLVSRCLAKGLLLDLEERRGSEMARGVQVHAEVIGDLVDNVDNKDDVGKTQGDELHQPEAEERNRREQVVADIGASRLDGVAHKAVLLVLVERVSGKKEGQDTQKDHHYEPHFPWEVQTMVRACNLTSEGEDLQNEP